MKWLHLARSPFMPCYLGLAEHTPQATSDALQVRCLFRVVGEPDRLLVTALRGENIATQQPSILLCSPSFTPATCAASFLRVVSKRYQWPALMVSTPEALPCEDVRHVHPGFAETLISLGAVAGMVIKVSPVRCPGLAFTPTARPCMHVLCGSHGMPTSCRCSCLARTRMLGGLWNGWSMVWSSDSPSLECAVMNIKRV